MPDALLTEYLKLPVFLLVASRLAGMIMFQPLLGGLSIPARVRAGLTVGLAALVVPFVDAGPETPRTPAAVALAMVGELLLGALLGLVIRICFVGLQMGSLLIAQESGLAFGQIVDPTTGEQDTVLSVFYVQMAVVIYLIVGGHRAVVAASLDTFRAIPLLGVGTSVFEGAGLLLGALSFGGEVAIRVAAPTVLTLFLVNVGLGFITRTVPQLNVATVGFSLKSLVSFVLMAVSLPLAATAFTEALAQAVGLFSELVGP